MKPIGVAHTPFKEKFGIPRQPGLAEAVGELEFFAPHDDPDAFEGVEQCSHLWLLFLFHHSSGGWAPKVRPPRLGGNRKLGVFATRSPNRPNPLGLSVVKLEGVRSAPLRLQVSGIDLLDGTPILDVKPYVPYVDAVGEARCSFAEPPRPLRVEFRDSALEDCRKHGLRLGVDLKSLVEQLLALDPRPAYHQDERTYGNRLYDLDVKWRVIQERVEVLEFRKASSSGSIS